jgi:DNA-binding winged helix-turn-helix (wHTH) protein/tetratricopeptide (TPR) repeat protein
LRVILSFGEFQLDIDRFELRQNGRLRKLEPKVYDLIAHLARNSGRVFSRDDLIASVWRGRLVSDATVSTCVKNARRVLGDSGDQQRYIQTVRGRGFRFAADVERNALSSESKSGKQVSYTARPRGSEPSLLVLPFRALSADPDVVRLAEGVSSDLGPVLSRIPLLRLSSHSAAYADQEIAPSVRKIHEDLGVDYVLEGTLKTRDRGYRINVLLSDAKSGYQLWTEQFSLQGPADAAQDQAVTALIAKLEPQLHRAIYNTVRATHGDPNARELFLQASSLLALKGWHSDSFSAAAELLRRSRKLDPEFALAPAYLALVTGLGERVGLADDREKAKAEALEAAERALELDNMDSTVLGFAGCALADIGYPERALPILRNAVEINPANAQAFAALGSVCLLTRRVEEAVQHLTHGINISPLDSRLSIWGAMLALGLMQLNDLDGALRQGELACQRDHRSYIPRIVVAGIHLLRNEPEPALEALNEAYRVKPDLDSVQIFPLLGRRLGSSLLELK